MNTPPPATAVPPRAPEPSPARAEAERSSDALILVLMITAPLALLFGVIILFVIWIASAFGGQNSLLDAVLQYGFAFVFTVTAPVALFVVAHRSRTRFGNARRRRAGRILGAVLGAVALVVSGLPFGIALALFSLDTGLRVKPLNANETNYSAADLREQSEKLLEQSVSGLSDVVRIEDEGDFVERRCSLSNLDDGVQLKSSGVAYLTSSDDDAILKSIAEQWDAMGYRASSIDTRATLVGKDWLVKAYAARPVVSDKSDPEIVGTYNVYIVLETICVVDTRD